MLNFQIISVLLAILFTLLHGETVREPFSNLFYEETSNKLFLSTNHLYFLDLNTTGTSNNSQCSRSITQLTTFKGSTFTILPQNGYNKLLYIDNYSTQYLFQQKFNPDYSQIECEGYRVDTLIFTHVQPSPHGDNLIYSVITNTANLRYNATLIEYDLLTHNYQIIYKSSFGITDFKIYDSRIYYVRWSNCNDNQRGLFTSSLDGSDFRKSTVDVGGQEPIMIAITFGNDYVYIITASYSILRCTVDINYNLTNCIQIISPNNAITSLTLSSTRLYWIENLLFTHFKPCTLIFSANHDGSDIQPIYKNNDSWFTCDFGPLYSYNDSTICITNTKDCSKEVVGLIIEIILGVMAFILFLVALGLTNKSNNVIVIEQPGKTGSEKSEAVLEPKETINNDEITVITDNMKTALIQSSNSS